MAFEFQFAFLGPGPNYIASLSKTNLAGFPLSEPEVKFSGLPSDFRDRYRKFLGLPAYICNIRGHDFLSFVAQWQGVGKDLSGHLDQNITMYKEIEALERFAERERSKNIADRKSKREANLIASFGPSSDSFFADSLVLERYRWSNLPIELEDEIEEVVCQKGWRIKGEKKIYDVAINGWNGWVMQLDSGREWRMGGKLHESLQRALEEGKWSKRTIAKLFLNHQNGEEYVLLFEDGLTYARLHGAFREDLLELLRSWYNAKSKNNKHAHESKWFNFTSSADSSEAEQNNQMAAYYAQRGLFYHNRGTLLLAQHLERVKKQPLQNMTIPRNCVRDMVMAHKYSREAYCHLPENLAIQKTYVGMLKAVRRFRRDVILEEELSSSGLAPAVIRRNTNFSDHSQRQSDDMKEFREEYVSTIRWLKKVDHKELAQELEEGDTQVPELSRASEPESGWSYTVPVVEALATLLTTCNREEETVNGMGEVETTGETQSDPGDTISFLDTGTERSVRSLPVERRHRFR